MKESKRIIFSIVLLIWLAGVAAMIHAIVYAASDSWTRQNAFLIVIALISFTQVVKKVFRWSQNWEKRK